MRRTPCVLTTYPTLEPGRWMKMNVSRFVNRSASSTTTMCSRRPFACPATARRMSKAGPPELSPRGSWMTVVSAIARAAVASAVAAAPASRILLIGSLLP